MIYRRLLAIAFCASLAFAEYPDGCTLYACVDFPGETWPGYPVPATSVPIGNPTGLAVDSTGNVYIAGPSIVFKLDPSGMLTRVAGNGHYGFSGDGGPATDALLGFPRGTPHDFIDFSDIVGSLAADSSGNLYIAVFNNRVRKITGDGVISTVAGAGFENPFGWPGGVAVDAQTSQVYAVGTFDTVWQLGPGGPTALMSNNCGNPSVLGLCVPYGAAVDGNGNVYVADNGNCRVLKRSPDGNITIFATALCPYGISVDGLGNLYVADTYNNRIVKILPDGTVTTIAGRGPSYGRYYKGGFSGDGGWAIDAELYLPHAVAVDPAGNVYIADSENFRVRKVTPDGIITTVAGNGTWGTF